MTAKTPRPSPPSTTCARRLAQWGLLRGDAIVALGGGVVGDTAGFVASVYHRGIDVVQAPTTLLAQVDAAIGGKTAVNLPEGKNLVGAFHQPIAVLADVSTLATLPPRDYRAGLGEVAKYALMPGGEAVAEIVGKQADAIVERDPDHAHRARRRLRVDEGARRRRRPAGAHRDPRVAELRAHVRARARDHAVATSSCTARRSPSAWCSPARSPARWSASMPRDVDAHRATVESLGLPTSVPGPIDVSDLLDVMRRDKKASGGLTFVLPGVTGSKPSRIPTRARSTSRSRPSAWEADHMPTILLLSGPNLNLFGQRDPAVYGTDTLDDMVGDARGGGGPLRLRPRARAVEPRRRDHRRHPPGARNRCAAIVINPGAFGHYSYAIADALQTFDGVKIELHVSNTAAREEWRHNSVISAYVTGTIVGLGRTGYRLAIEGVVAKLA